MENFKCLIIDDELQAIEFLQDSLNLLYKNIEVAGTYRLWTDALQALRSTDADIIFLDISMQNRNGMDLLKHVSNLKAEVIFVTAYSDYALEAYKLSASGYIVKPVDEAELTKTVDKALERIQNKRLAARVANPDLQSPTKIGIPNNNTIDYIAISDIVYLLAEGSYTRIVTINGTHVSSFNLQRFRDILDASKFYQIHRAYIINVNRVKRYENSGNLVMDNNDQVPVSRNSRDGFLKIFQRVSNQNTKD